MQSWGSGSMFDTRETDDYPTKSGVIGMIASALGRKRDESLKDLTELRYGIRIDDKGERITDFQITDMGPKLKANLSFRSYLCDALFLAGLETENLDRLKEIEKALSNPAFPLYLGRRSCPVTLPVVIGIRNKYLYDALFDEGWLLSDWRRKQVIYEGSRNLRIIMEDPESGTLKKDVTVSFSPFKRVYEYRGISEKNPKTVFISENNYETDHDPMTELR